MANGYVYKPSVGFIGEFTGGQPYVKKPGTANMVPLQAKWVMRIVQTGFSPPTFTETWVRMWDSRAPTLTPFGQVADDGSTVFTYPHPMRVVWTSSPGSGDAWDLSIRIFRSTNSGASYSVDQTIGAAAGVQQVIGASDFYPLDMGYAELKYQSHDGGVYGPAVTTDVVTF